MDKVIFSGFILLSILLTVDAFADGVEGSHAGKGDLKADASVDDKRLPPVYPGEEVSDGKKTIKSWSTSGSVAVAPVPTVPQPTNNILGGEVGVIVDRRRE